MDDNARRRQASVERRAEWRRLLVWALLAAAADIVAAWVLAVASLWLLNFNFWALTAVPTLLLATRVDLRVPRVRWVFYAFYPVHLAVLWGLR